MDLQKYLFRVFYLGNHFTGFQRQPNGNTVENYIEMAFVRSNLIWSFTENSYQSISRTDTRVSAIGNVFTLLCTNTPNLARINANFPNNNSIRVWSYAPINEDFKAKKPKYKVYAYHLSYSEFDSIFDIERLYQFEGEHNFSTFIKKDGAGSQNTPSLITDISIKGTNNGHYIIIKGDKFGREQIRRMIGYIMDSKYEKRSLPEILKRQPKIPIHPAEPSSLFLIKVQYTDTPGWIGSFDISSLKDGEHHFKSKYALFSPFENEFE
ncbi:MAG: hypothetical protein GPJ54_15150 [Candidatus Heimdallarchaeota archaeon]|nr:hypothetical protein [Candidatus Heimdallarchaeota archaeon]